MNPKSTLALVVLALLVLLASSSMYTIKETELGVKLWFGEVVDAGLKPGLHFKVPIAHEIRRFDSRVLGMDARAEEFLTQEKKRLVVDSFVMWRISDARTFYTSTGGSEDVARRLLAPRINEGLRNKVGQRSMYQVVSGEREEIMIEITDEINSLTQNEFGIDIIDVRMKKIELPPNVRGNVYDRMRAERQREAREHRSKGKELAEGITADADRQQRVIVAEAYREAEKIRGRGDAQAAKIYAQAYNQDPEFYSFHRSLTAYRKTFNQNNGDVFVLEPKGEFFQFLKESGGK